MNVHRYIERRMDLMDEIRCAASRNDWARAESLQAELAKMPALPPSTFFCGFCGSERHKAPRCPKLI